MTRKTDQTLYQGRYLTLLERDGWEFIERRHGVAVLIAWTPDRELLLVEQYRIPIGRRTIELPAGLVGDEPGRGTEDLLEAAGRELTEETGWRAGQLTELMNCPTSAGLSSETVTFVLARDLEQVAAGGGDDSEDIVVHRIPGVAVKAWLNDRYRAGMAIDPKIYAALFWSDSTEAPDHRADGKTHGE
ncbi:MAG: NUDIX hydrolase [Wenzhouxiangella sp.]|nr:MAG: NUDIX hydrolase [Wenzhouxiangella sp.]